MSRQRLLLALLLVYIVLSCIQCCVLWKFNELWDFNAIENDGKIAADRVSYGSIIIRLITILPFGIFSELTYLVGQIIDQTIFHAQFQRLIKFLVGCRSHGTQFEIMLTQMLTHANGFVLDGLVFVVVCT